MKILLMANHCNTGGITSYLLNLSRGLIKKGHQVYLICSQGDCASFFSAAGVHCLFLDIRVKSEVHPKLWRALPKVFKFIKDHKIGMIHAQTRVTQVMAAIISLMVQIPYVTTCHGFFKTRIFRRLFPCWGKKVIAISQGVQIHLLNDFHCSGHQVAFIPNGIDIAQFKPLNQEERIKKRKEWGVKEDSVVGIIARLSSVKGIHIFINAIPDILKKNPFTEFWIVGEGPEKLKLQEQAKALGVDHAIQFKEIVKRTAEILPIFDVFVMPSIQEGLGLSVMEAQAAGIPVVASDVGGLPDLVRDGLSGFLVPVSNSKLLADRVVYLLKNYDVGRSMAQEARLRIARDFSLDQMINKTIKIYEENSCR